MTQKAGKEQKQAQIPVIRTIPVFRNHQDSPERQMMKVTPP